MRIVSTNVGRRERNATGKATWTGHDKRPVDGIDVRDPGPKRLGHPHASGVDGDFVGDTRHHGGSLQAVYAVGREDLDHWASVLARDLPNGWMGENLTTAGWDLNQSLLGTRWQVGTALLRVSVPRIPCSTFAAVAQRQGWIKQFTRAGGAGTYLEVLVPGHIDPGDEVHVVHVPDHGVSVRDLFGALTDRPDLAEHVLSAREELPSESIVRLTGVLRRPVQPPLDAWPGGGAAAIDE